MRACRRPMRLRFFQVLLGISFLALAAATFLAATASPANATTKRRVDVKCPVCGASFQAYAVSSSNTMGGRDRDFCVHARGDQPLAIIVWTCPQCSYSGNDNDFAKEPVEEIRGWLRQELGALRGSWPEKDLPAWRRWMLAAKAAEIRGADRKEIGLCHLFSAWCLRFAAFHADPAAVEEDESHPDPDLAVVIPFLEGYLDRASEGSEKANPSDVDLAAAGAMAGAFETDPNAAAHRPAWCLLIALLYRSRGEHGPAEEWLGRFEAYADAGEKEKAGARARVIREGIEREKERQREALRWFVQHLEGEEKPSGESAFLAYLVGETYRRLGESGRAVFWMKHAIGLDDVEEGVLELAERGLRDLGIEVPRDPDRATARERARIARLIEALKDPRLTFRAGGELREIKSHGLVVDALLKALQEGDGPLRGRVASLLGQFDDPRVLPTLREILAKDRDPTARFQAFGHLQEDRSPETLRALLECLKTEDGFGRAEMMVRTVLCFAEPEASEGIAEQLQREVERGRILQVRDRSETRPGEKNFGEFEYFRILLLAAGSMENAKAADPLVRIAAEGLEEDLARSAGVAFERLTNHGFGFGWCDGRTGAEETPSSLQECRNKMALWWAAHRDESLAKWVSRGFWDNGFAVEPACDPSRLDTLLLPLRSSRPWLRFNARLRLARLTGCPLDRDEKWAERFSWADGTAAAVFFKEWIETRRGRLSWDDPSGRFTVKEK